jgi:crotonobetainyl-CoA:carnitine CoA-transferase CaiB-like acyl-CoA transferase
MLPLEGITVVSLEQAVAAPFANRQLADLGARVIKHERVYLPGEIELEKERERRKDGIPLSAEVLDELRSVSERHKVPVSL